MLAVPRVAAVAAVQTAGVLEPPVPAARRLQEVPADRAHVPQLWRRREPARLAERLGSRERRLELSERRPGADRVAVDTAGHDTADVDEPVGLEDPVTEQRYHLGAPMDEGTLHGQPAVELCEIRRPQELHVAPSS